MGHAPADRAAGRRAPVAREIDALGARSGSPVLDVVAFSMGALTTRVCLQRETGSLVTKVRRFVSISGPHGGALNAFGLPAKLFPGVADMRPGSALLAGARSVTSFPVAMHRFMVSDARVLDHVAAVLSAA